MVLNKKSMVLIHSTNGSRGLPLAVRLHLDARRGGSFSLGLLPPPLLSQSDQMDDTVHLPIVGKTWREGNNKRGND